MGSCPQCSSQDSVQKVSAIVAGGTYQITYNVPAQGEIAGHKIYGTVQQKGRGQSELAQMLSLDMTEKYWKKWRLEFAKQRAKEFEALNPQPAKGCLGTFNVVTSTVLFLGSFLGVVLLCNGSSLMAAGPRNVGIAAGVIVCLVALVWVFLAQSGWGARKDFREWSKARSAVMATALSEATRIKSQTVSRWQMLFYCHHCDIVFLPENGLFAPAGEMLQMLMWRS